tara:strand:- start:625 stop:1215 length:591 start_codon:yes stop_codon:yes gene_type:complete
MLYEQQLKALIIFTSELDAGLFSRVKQIKGLISSQFEKNVVADKARFVFVKNPEDLLRTDNYILVHERGSDTDTSRDNSWKIEHDKHKCKHDFTVPDKEFINKFHNYKLEKVDGQWKRKHKIGGKPRCYEHKSGDCCVSAKEKNNRLMCDEHNGWDCCGMTENAKISQFSVRVKKEEVLAGSICISEEDKELTEQL